MLHLHHHFLSSAASQKYFLSFWSFPICNFIHKAKKRKKKKNSTWRRISIGTLSNKLLCYNTIGQSAMTLIAQCVQPSLPNCSPTFTCHLNPSFRLREIPEKVPKSIFTRRIGALAAMANVLLVREAVFSVNIANGLDFKMVAPDQTLEQAESGIRAHALALLQVKALIESNEWKDMQKALRKSSALLKQDIYTIIQSKPGSQRPQLRKLYSNLFNSVTRLDYAARDKDAVRVQEYYEQIAITLGDILSRV